MYQLLAQAAATPVPTITVTATPTTTATATSDISIFLKDTFTSLIGIDIFFVMKLVFVWVLLIWLVFAFWVALDALQRYRNPLYALFWFVFVLPFNVFGLIGYLFIRPTLTLEEKEWTKLEAKYLMYELSSVNDCPSCKTVVPVNHNYCPVCGYQMNVTCEKCSHIQSIYNAHCVSCGVKIKTADESLHEKHAQRMQLPAENVQTGSKVLSDVTTGFNSVISNFTSQLKKMQPAAKVVKQESVKTEKPAPVIQPQPVVKKEQNQNQNNNHKGGDNKKK